MIDLLFQALWVLAFFRRRNEIGGALLVFFVQASVQFALSLILVVSVLVAWQKRARDVPLPFHGWELRVSLSILVMSFVASAVIAVAALALLKTRSWQYTMYIRSGLFALVVLAVVNLLYHRVNVANCLELIFPLLFFRTSSSRSACSAYSPGRAELSAHIDDQELPLARPNDGNLVLLTDMRNSAYGKRKSVLSRAGVSDSSASTLSVRTRMPSQAEHPLRRAQREREPRTNHSIEGLK